MSEPVTPKLNVVQLVIELGLDVSEATGLRELADHLDALDHHYLLHAVTYCAGDQYGDGPKLLAMVENLGTEE